MLLLLVRHARAGDRDPSRWSDDSLRPLTNVGREIHSQVSRSLARLECAPEAILTSPWVRAVQTADLMVEEMELDVEPVRCEALARDVEIADIAQQVKAVGDATVIALVGHAPWIEELASVLLGQTIDSVKIDFPKSGVLGMDIDEIAPGGGTLRFFLRPRHIRNINRKNKKR